MKKYLYLLLLALPLCTVSCSKDDNNEPEDPIIRIPDIVFADYLLNLYDDNNDGYLTKSEAVYVNRISARLSGIESLTGIEHFTNLTYLDVYGNDLKTIDLINNTKLEYINVSFCGLEGINLRACKNLKFLYCQTNDLTRLDLSLNTKLTTVDCMDNFIEDFQINAPDLTYLACSGNYIPNMEFVKNLPLLNTLLCECLPEIKTLDISNNLNLKELYCSECDNLTTIYLKIGQTLETLDKDAIVVVEYK